MDNSIAVIVDRGDTLFGIARFYTGNADNWRQLAVANGLSFMNDQPILTPGQRLIIPPENLKGVLRPPVRSAT